MKISIRHSGGTTYVNVSGGSLGTQVPFVIPEGAEMVIEPERLAPPGFVRISLSNGQIIAITQIADIRAQPTTPTEK